MMTTTGVATLVEVDSISRTYGSRGMEVPALQDVSFTVRAGELLAVRGRSGSGKTTLLNCIGGIDRPDSGRVVIDGVDVTALGEHDLLALRRDRVSYVFQSFGLLPMLTAAENVGIPLRIRRVSAAEREERVASLLRVVGLGGHAGHRPSELSGGQQQRVAIARALASEPRVLLADEPTGQLDSQTGRAVMELLHGLVRGAGLTAVVTTHDATLLAEADRVLELRDGRVADPPHDPA